jgi:hypothetical protein
MTFIWTRSLFLKKISTENDFIGYFLEEPCGHFGILINNRILHWSFRGFIDDSIEDFFKKRKRIFSKYYELESDEDESKIYENMKYKYRGSTYDFMYLFWLTWRGFLLFSFNRPIPYGEPFGDTTNNMLCHEALEGLPDRIRPEYDRDKANTPYRLYIELTKGEK